MSTADCSEVLSRASMDCRSRVRGRFWKLPEECVVFALRPLGLNIICNAEARKGVPEGVPGFCDPHLRRMNRDSCTGEVAEILLGAQRDVSRIDCAYLWSSELGVETHCGFWLSGRRLNPPCSGSSPFSPTRASRRRCNRALRALRKKCIPMVSLYIGRTKEECMDTWFARLKLGSICGSQIGGVERRCTKFTKGGRCLERVILAAEQAGPIGTFCLERLAFELGLGGHCTTGCRPERSSDAGVTAQHGNSTPISLGLSSTTHSIDLVDNVTLSPDSQRGQSTRRVIPRTLDPSLANCLRDCLSLRSLDDPCGEPLEHCGPEYSHSKYLSTECVVQTINAFSTDTGACLPWLASRIGLGEECEIELTGELRRSCRKAYRTLPRSCRENMRFFVNSLKRGKCDDMMPSILGMDGSCHRSDSTLHAKCFRLESCRPFAKPSSAGDLSTLSTLGYANETSIENCIRDCFARWMLGGACPGPGSACVGAYRGLRNLDTTCKQNLVDLGSAAAREGCGFWFTDQCNLSSVCGKQEAGDLSVTCGERLEALSPDCRGNFSRVIDSFGPSSPCLSSVLEALGSGRACRGYSPRIAVSLEKAVEDCAHLESCRAVTPPPGPEPPASRDGANGLPAFLQNKQKSSTTIAWAQNWVITLFGMAVVIVIIYALGTRFCMRKPRPRKSEGRRRGQEHSQTAPRRHRFAGRVETEA